MDSFSEDKEQAPKKIHGRHFLHDDLKFDEKKYEFSEAFVAGNPDDPRSVHTVAELVESLKRKKCEIDARVLGLNREGKRAVRRMNTTEFLEAVKTPDDRKFRESFDGFANDDSQVLVSRVGEDFLPLVGGPFYKQLYYRDYLRMHSAAFYAFNHDPIARAITNLITDFTLGRGFTVDSDDNEALALWNAFFEANNLDVQFEQLSSELTIYGEIMLWWLPNNQSRIVFSPRPGENIPTGILPRVRLVDPSNIWDIVTYPEDITRVINYTWLAPTQYQTFTAGDAPTLKFIFQQIPGDQIDHWKINAVSNEKRGRSDYFPALGYMKRLRDSVNYGVIGLQKAAAWGIDTEINGNQEDIDNYISDQKSTTIQPAGSEFVHSTAIKRQYLGNSHFATMDDKILLWCLNMICATTGIPTGYLGTHMAGGGTRAAALVATEPVAKKFERRQKIYERIVKKMWRRLMDSVGSTAECKVTFPELITQDRSKKIQDINFAEMSGYVAHNHAATMVAKELDIPDYDYDDEKVEMDKNPVPPPPAGMLNPLTAGGALPPEPGVNGMTGGDKKAVKDNELNKGSMQ